MGRARCFTLPLLAVLGVALTGCTPAAAPGYLFSEPDYARVALPRQASGSSADAVTVSVRAGDDRFIGSRALVDAVRSSVEVGLVSRGFVVSEDGARVEVRVEHVYVDVYPGFWSTKASSEIVVRCRVGRASGAVELDKRYVGRSGQPISVRKADHARQAALADVIGQVVGDETFVAAVKAAR